MAFLEFKNVRLAGISAGVPKKVINNLELQNLSKDYDAAAFVETTGVKERRVDNFTTSDLCLVAAEQLIKDLNWVKSEIEAIIFVSQTTDYYLPATACILQDKLGLSKECYASDVVIGCSGWVYGLSNVVSLMSFGGIKKALLMAGDAKRAFEDEDPLFGFAGTVTALEYKEGDEGFKFHFGTDGSGFDAIIVPDGGARNQITHQANMKMNNMIMKKLKLDPEKVPTCMYNFGNTSSASIPLTIVTQLKSKFESKPTKFICCGFGVGLSWGTVAFETNNVIISDLVEI